MLQRMMRCISAISCSALKFPDISIVLLGRKLKLQAIRKRLRLCQNVLCGVGTLKHIISIGPLGTDYMVPNYDCILHVDYYDIFQRSRSPLEGAILRGESGEPLLSIGTPAVICAKNGWTDRGVFRLWARMGPRNRVLDGDLDPHAKGQFRGIGAPIVKCRTFCRELCKNGWTDRFAVCVVDSSGPKDA